MQQRARIKALERFRAMQTAYEVLSDPHKRRRYDMDSRLQHRREWRRCAWDGPSLQLQDKVGAADEPEGARAEEARRAAACGKAPKSVCSARVSGDTTTSCAAASAPSFCSRAACSSPSRESAASKSAGSVPWSPWLATDHH